MSFARRLSLGALRYRIPCGPCVLRRWEDGDAESLGLLRKPSIEPWDEFTCLNSLRDVEATANLILDTSGMGDEDEDEEGAVP